MIDNRVIHSALLALAVAACSPPVERSIPEGVAALPAATMDSLLASEQEAGDGSIPTVMSTQADSLPGAATLAEIGYRDGITFTGAVDAATISIPVNRGRRATELALQLSPTPRMPDATI
ncbi:MAG TPA: hypothetical protein PLL69_07650, partial [Gemmatimonadales bacterium]|nr:hypothetical protein [Gemmatimonadales bacterium]